MGERLLPQEGEPRRPVAAAPWLWYLWTPWLLIVSVASLFVPSTSPAANACYLAAGGSWAMTLVSGYALMLLFWRNLVMRAPQVATRHGLRSPAALKLLDLYLVRAARDGRVRDDSVLREYGSRVEAIVYGPLAVLLLLVLVGVALALA